MGASSYGPFDLAEGVLTIRLPVAHQASIASELTTSLHVTTPLQVNAMNNLMALLSFAQADENVNVIVLRDEGEQFGASLGAADIDPEVSHQLVQRLRDLPQPVVAMVHGQIHHQALALLQVCDIVLATGQDDWATLSFPTSELEEQTYKLARELASKDPLILRFTKKTVQQVASIAWEDILSFTTAQQAEIKSLQAGRPSPRALAIESFLAGKSKPGAGA
jgi:enoyl-CoA hydratase/carnithine racemase